MSEIDCEAELGPVAGHPFTAGVQSQIAIHTVFDGNSVEHVTFSPAGDEVWFTFTETGKFTFTMAAVHRAIAGDGG